MKKKIKPPIVLLPDFEDIKHGIELLDSEPTYRQAIAKQILADLERLGSSSAVDYFRLLLYGTEWFNDPPSPHLARALNDVVLEYSGRSAESVINQAQRKLAQEHGKRGGRGKMIGATVTTNAARDKDVHAEFEEYRARASSDREAAKNMELDHYIDTNGVALKYSAILKAVRRIREKNNN